MASLARLPRPLLTKFKQFVRLAPSSRGFALDEDGDYNSMRTTVTILNEEQQQGVFVDAYSSQGFRLSSGLRVMGPCAIFPRSILHWNVSGVRDIHERSLSLFAVLEPKIDILVIGVGERENIGKVDSSIYTFLKFKQINVEVLTTDQALSTFNFLNSEKRYVAGAFIPPAFVDTLSEDDLYLAANRGGEVAESYGDPFVGDPPPQQIEDRTFHPIGSPENKDSIHKALHSLRKNINATPTKRGKRGSGEYEE